jgi:colicin import membrane protein
MPRKFKTYVTSVGFFEQAIAAPSMKAALEAWGAPANLFQQGLAKETDDPAIVAATMAKPGVILKRGIGSKGPFTENAALPKSLPVEKVRDKVAPKPKAKAAKEAKAAAVVNLAEVRAAKEAAAAFEKERARREREHAREEAARAREAERRAEAVRKAEAALEKARKQHDDAMADIKRARESLQRREQDENARWAAEKEKLEAAVDRADR